MRVWGEGGEGSVVGGCYMIGVVRGCRRRLVGGCVCYAKMVAWTESNGRQEAGPKLELQNLHSSPITG